MKEIHLKDIDLNLLLIFHRIYIRKNLTLAAEDLGRTQSAMSHALERLRVLFDDPLFVRSSKTMKPTPRAEALSDPIKEAITAAGHVFLPPEEFSAGALKRSFTISMSDYCQVVVLPKLMKMLLKEAPGVSIEVPSLQGSNLQAELESGYLDLVIGNKDFGAGVMQQVLFEDEFICLVNDRHKLVKSGMTTADYTGYAHVLFTTKGKGDRLIEETLKKKGIRRDVALRLPNVLVIPKVILETPYIVTLPLRLAHSLEIGRLKKLPPPVPLPNLPIMQYWHSSQQNDSAHKWLRHCIHGVLQ